MRTTNVTCGKITHDAILYAPYLLYKAQYPFGLDTVRSGPDTVPIKSNLVWHSGVRTLQPRLRLCPRRDTMPTKSHIWVRPLRGPSGTALHRQPPRTASRVRIYPRGTRVAGEPGRAAPRAGGRAAWFTERTLPQLLNVAVKLVYHYYKIIPIFRI